LNPRIPGGYLLNDVAGRIRAAVVDDEDLYVIESLAQRGGERFGDQSFPVVDGNEDGHLGHAVRREVRLEGSSDTVPIPQNGNCLTTVEGWNGDRWPDNPTLGRIKDQG
jgi:hypothetical protein